MITFNWITIWLCLMAILIVVELIVPTFSFFIWFAVGAGICSLLAYLKLLEPQSQVILFVVLSSILVFATKPLQKKLKVTSDKNIDTKLRIVGKRVEVVEEINNFKEVGKVYLEGSYWRARSQNEGDVCEIGEIVEIVEVDGIKLVVKKINEN